MRIHSVRIKNYRGFLDDTILLNGYTSLIGPNGAGKSTVLAALNIFFQEQNNATDVAVLTEEDFHNGDTKNPVEITVTFNDLSSLAKSELKHYVRHDELKISAVAVYDPALGKAPVQQFGIRQVYKKFTQFFDDDKSKASAEELKARFFEITKDVKDFPSIGSKPAKQVMIDALRAYEEKHPELCDPVPSSDLFYGATKGKGRIESFIQWIYIPAVKEVSDEAEETGNTALGKLLQRTVRKKVKFDDAIKLLREKTRDEYDQILEDQQNTLKEISESLAKKLAIFAHPDASVSIEWIQGSEKSVSINDPRAVIKAQEGIFKGKLVRFGHGLQRSFFLAILQELASLEGEETDAKEDRPTLILACEEPELYQHPPQARHLENVLRSLAEHGNQIIFTTHSPYFVSGETYEEIRLIRRDRASGKSYVRQTEFSKFAERIAKITGNKPEKPSVVRAKLYAGIRPEPAEMFFCQKLVLVEGIEDRAYLSAALKLNNQWDEVRRAGLHIIPAERKSYILQLLIIAQELEIPCFVVFDADGDVVKPEQRTLHESDNKNLISALGVTHDPFPKSTIWENNCAIWSNNIETEIKKDMGAEEWRKLKDEARKSFDPGASLNKNPLLIAETLRLAWEQGKGSAALVKLANHISKFSNT